MSNLIDIKELRKEFSEKINYEDLKQFAESQQKIIENQIKQIQFLKEKLKHLETILMKQVVTEVTPEETICVEQIDRLKKLSEDRQLTLEEVKRLDLLVKNLKLIREESTIVLNDKRSNSLKEADLVAIARSNEPEDN